MKHKKGWQPAGWKAFVEACPTCLNLGSELCFKCKMEVESGYDPKDEVTNTNTGTYTMYVGQRGGGKIFFLEQMCSMTRAQLKDTKQELERGRVLLFTTQKRQPPITSGCPHLMYFLQKGMRIPMGVCLCIQTTTKTSLFTMRR